VAPGASSRRGRIAVTIAGIGLGAATAAAIADAPAAWPYAGGPVTALGSIAAMTGTYLCLVLLVLVARIPWIEREVGHDRLVALHRTVAPYSIVLISLHVLLTTLGYAQVAEAGFVAQLWNLVLHSAWMLPAFTAFVLFLVLGVISYRRIRERMRYETWWTAHLYFYLAVALAFGHQLELSSFLATQPLQKWFWVGLYVATFGLIVVSRFALPLAMSLRHDLRVAAVVRESPDVVSVYLRGRDLDRLRARGGQFLQWRFMTRHWWWQAHPYSLSASPNPYWLRITVKALGDHSGGLVDVLRPGLRVWAEGPYGVFTADRSSRRVAAFASGIGVTPVRAMLEELPEGSDVDVVVRVRSVDTAPLRAELEELARSRGFRLRYLERARSGAAAPGGAIAELIPDLADRDVYVCGPVEFTDAVLDAARAAGVPKHRLHHETFSF
jgi:predicted ferric reductase